MPKSTGLRTVDRHRAQLLQLVDPEGWIMYLRQHSCLPGPRANLELLHAFVAVAPRDLIVRLSGLPPAETAPNTPAEFLLLCGTAAIGRLIAAGDHDGCCLRDRLRNLARDGRWRVREAVAMALQHLGRLDFAVLATLARDWIAGGFLEQRAVVAGLAEPDLLRTPAAVSAALAALNAATAHLSYASPQVRKLPEFRILRQGLAYCWSVVVAADPATGQPAFAAWLGSADRDVRWVLAQNLAKKRLASVHPAWVEGALARLGAGQGPDPVPSAGGPMPPARESPR